MISRTIHPRKSRRRRPTSPLTLLLTLALFDLTTAFTSPRPPLSAPSTRHRTLPLQESTEKERSPLSKAYHLYIDYFDRLWAETDVEKRKKAERQRAIEAVLRVKHMCDEEEFEDVRGEVGEALGLMLDRLGKDGEVNEEEEEVGSLPTSANGESASSLTATQNQPAAAALTPATTSATTTTTAPKKNRRSILFGALMGLTVAAWVYSGSYLFTLLFTLMTALGQLEYYRMVMSAGIYPARRISVLGACATFVAALWVPDLHQMCLPFFSTVAMVWFLTKRKGGTTISEIATTFTGMFYLGYIPSYWVRLRLIGSEREATRLAPLIEPILNRISDIDLRRRIPKFLPKTIDFPVTTGANFIFWSWICIAFADVGGYFAGRKFGSTKLGAISPAAGKASPNKTLEGVAGGCVFSVALATLGAWVQKWPYWAIVGPVHGVLLALLGLVGDLTASMLKRDAGLKDFGDLIPEHGGIMDRVDSYIFTAPYGYFVCAYFIPWLKTIAKARSAAGPLAI